MPDKFESAVMPGINNLSDGGKTAIVLCAGSFRFGGNWGFLPKTTPGYESILETLKTEHKSVTIIAVSNGSLILCDKNYLAFNVNTVVPNAINGDFAAMAAQRNHDEKIRFYKFVKSIHEGKTKGDYIHTLKDGTKEITLGVYSMNDTNRISINGIDYPAYKLTLMEALDSLRQLKNAGHLVQAKAIHPKTGVAGFGDIEQLSLNSNGRIGLYLALEIADSKTGAFLTLRVK